MTHYLDRIWLYSAFYGEQLRISAQLHEEGNSYAAFLLLFNILELLCKSLKESDDGNVVSDIKWMLDNALITPEEEAFLNGQDGIRKIRNIMTHINLYEYCFEDDEIVYSFADSETWDIAYANYTPQIIEIMYNAIVNKDEMVELKHEYFTRRQFLRSQINYNLAAIADLRVDVDLYVDKLGEKAVQVRAIVDKVDEINKGLGL